MPELPEVETVTKSVRKHLINKNFNLLTVNWEKTLHNFTQIDFENKIRGKWIKNVYRRAKYIIIDLNDNLLAIHLRMTGKLYVTNTLDYKKKHISLYLEFDKKYLVFEDTRKFGRFFLYDSMEYLNDKLGIEPLSNGFTENWILDNIKGKNRQIKSLLLDQSVICGLGNIYVDEALWYSEIHPLAISSSISNRSLLKLREGIRKILSDSIKLGGTTIRDYTYDYAYVGNYTLNLNVFGKQGSHCPRCKNSIIIKNKVAQRGTHYCPKCQRRYI